MKIILIGSSGSGKSTLTRELSVLTESSVLHLDRVFHATTQQPREVLRQTTRSFIASHESWIIDGNYGSTLDERIPFADVIIWLKVPRPTAVMRVVKRSVKARWLGQKRQDMASEFVEKWDKEYLEFLKFVWNFPKTEFPQIEENLTKFDAWDKVVILKNRKDKAKYLTTLQKIQKIK
ncbi:adenylate kinase [Lactococcus allomyrinae]|uniref:Adenylate kinase n=1 Tax=Lactococcus allomyrinae TaxID=2419773 RepID=A0A387BCJ9_9LACT|nr:adenylate kinase [Lactococcus allomyrinae]AYF99731.1 adenylate kinase [Lactococcus allomyrinae]